MLKTRPLFLLAGLLAGLLLTACTSAVTGRPVAVPNPTKPKPPLSLVLLMPSLTDPQSKRLVQAVTDYAKEHKGKLERITTSGSTNGDGPFLTRAIQQKPTVVIVSSVVAVDKLAAAVAANNKQQFLLLGSCLGKNLPPNLTCTDTREHEGVYLMGIEAGLLTTTGKVGAVVAANNIPQLKRFSVPFGQGAAASRPGTTYQEALVGTGNSFSDPVAAGQAATSLGASHVMTSAFGGNPGVFQAAQAGGFGVFGMDESDCAADSATVVDSLVVHPEVVIKDSLDAIDAGGGGQLRSYGLKEKVVSLHSLEPDVAASKCAIAGKSDVIAKVGEFREKIVSGELKIADPASS
jgi:basic membrane protein A